MAMTTTAARSNIIIQEASQRACPISIAQTHRVEDAV
jgi:hypothetical protein